MVTLPSFSPEQAIILDENIEYKEISPGDYEVVKKQFFLKHVSFKKKARFKRPFDKEEPYEKIDIDQDIDRHTLLVSEEFVSAIEKAWACVLKETKYPEERRIGLDGTTYIFHCDRYYGLIWSPDSGLTATLVELGNKLSELARSETKDIGTIKTQCLELAEEIMKNQK